MSLKLFGWPKGTEEKKLPSGKKEIILPEPTNMKEFGRSRTETAPSAEKNQDKEAGADNFSPKIEAMRNRSYDDTSGESHSPFTRQDKLKREREEERRMKAV